MEPRQTAYFKGLCLPAVLPIWLWLWLWSKDNCLHKGKCRWENKNMNESSCAENKKSQYPTNCKQSCYDKKSKLHFLWFLINSNPYCYTITRTTFKDLLLSIEKMMPVQTLPHTYILFDWTEKGFTPIGSRIFLRQKSMAEILTIV